MYTEIIAIIFAVGGPLCLVGFILYYHYTTRNRERLSLIEKGLDPSLLSGRGEPDPNGALTLRFGILFVGVAVGILCGHLLRVATGFDAGVAYISMILLFGGASLILSYVLLQKKLESGKGDES